MSPSRNVPDHIKKPSYYKTGIPDPGPETAEVKNVQQISKMRDSCKLAANILQRVGKHLKVFWPTTHFYKNAISIFLGWFDNR